MSQTALKIDEVKAIELYPTASKEWKEVFEQTFGKKTFIKRVQDWVKTPQDVLDYLHINDYSFLPFRNACTPVEKQLNATAWIHKIAEIYNEGKKLDANNPGQNKYYPYKYRSGGGWSLGCSLWVSDCRCPVGLCYVDSELAIAAATNFPDIYNDFWMLPAGS